MLSKFKVLLLGGAVMYMARKPLRKAAKSVVAKAIGLYEEVEADKKTTSTGNLSSQDSISTSPAGSA